MSGAKLSIENFQIGLMVSLITQPFEVIRTSSIMTLKELDKGFFGTLKVAKQIYTLEGVRGFFRGGLSGMARSTLSSGIFFTGIENFHLLTKGLRNNGYVPNNVIDFLNAGMTRMINTAVNNPLTVVKTKFEVVGKNEYKSIAQAISHIYQRDGIRGFYKGIMTTLMRDVPWSGIQYSSYKYGIEWYKGLNPDKNLKTQPLAVSLIAATSSAFAVIITYPFDNLRVRYQCYDLSDQKFNKPYELVKKILKEEGVGGFYLGLLPRLMKKASSQALTWVLYETIRKESIIH
jgi:solute carrier family 25, member 38